MELPNGVSHLVVFVSVIDPFRIESRLPVWAPAVVGPVTPATVHASCLVGAFLPFRGGGNRLWYALGALRMGITLAAGRERAVEFNGVGAVADRAVAGFEGAGPRIRTMAKPPAPGALGHADALISRGDDESVFAVHKRPTDKVPEGQAPPGVVDIEPHRAPVGAR